MYSMKLEWKEFNVDLGAMEAWFKEQSEDYTGNSADSALTLWFQNEPSDDIKEAIQAKWDGLEADSAEAESYKSMADVEADVATKKASAKAKLIALGLSEDEIAALSLA